MVVKRGRISMDSSADRNASEEGEFNHILINYSGPSFSDLPRDIMINVLLRLPVKRVIVCKFVCKTWHDLISEPEFAKLHYHRAEAYPLIHISSHTKLSRTVHLVPPEEENFERKLEICNQSVYGCECDCRRLELETEPLGDPGWIFDRSVLERVKYRNYGVVNSCNGLLCLSHPYDNDPIFVCNPVTGEFVGFPKKSIFDGNGFPCGFGFSSASNQYKVVRMFQRCNQYGKTSNSIGNDIRAQVYTLGSETWKDIEFSAQKKCGLGTTYLNGFLYWLEGQPYGGVLSFDIENECFSSFPVPPMTDYTGLIYIEVSIGVSGGQLCIYCFCSMGETRVRVMKDDGTTKVWSDLFSIQLHWNPRWDIGSCKPIKYLNDGALLMFKRDMNFLIYKHPRRHGTRCFRFCRDEKLEVTAHIPSLVSLKDALMGHNVKVLKSRCFVLL